ncbi:MAG: hypothetical protein U0002_10555 [Thermoanaerobaculia bacterium]
MRTPAWIGFLAALGFLPQNGFAALPNPPHEDVHFLAEHLPESAQDARFLALPWPAAPLDAGSWQFAVQLGYNRTEASFLTLDGPMLAASGVYGFSDRWGLELLGFYDSQQVGGGSGREVLSARFLRGVPPDLPEEAEFSNPQGDYLHWGAGALVVHELSPATARGRWSLSGGLLLSRLEITDYRFDYRLAGGVNAGARGTLDHSSQASFVVPLVGLQRIAPLGTGFTWAPRFVAGVPLPPGDFDGRLSGPGFDLSTARGQGKAGHIGDGFFGVGLGLLHRASGLELDLGATLYYPLFEKLTHPGVDQAYLAQLTWHFGRR